ncbi:uncharacterized protein LOC135712784 [Ochlerotatus camptorhynchus]|uniref:uncharacterized protein LOC135712784 n=1 Tax=Ochlerotatus camptorhynchus TaxID=644619 RepID=UPI0031D27A0D
MGKCCFRVVWLKQVDSSGCTVSDWAKKHSETEVFCKICRKSFSITKGFQAIDQHARSAKHRDAWIAQHGANQMHLTVEQEAGSSGTVPNKKLQLFSARENSAKAEILWLLKCIAADFPVSSCDGIRETFCEMFPGGVPSDFSLGRCKARYVITDALAPYFREQQLIEIRSSHYTLCYDETTNAAGKKELQILLRYWSQKQSRVVIMYLETFFIGSAKAEDVLQKLNDALQNASLPRSNMIMLGSDGPNVNKKIERLMNEQLIEERGKSLLSVGTCNIHILHNGYLKGLEELGEDASDLIVSVYHFFKGWPARCEDYEKIQSEVGVPTHRFIKHVSSRWLTMEQAAERVIEQWPAVTKYFTDFIPKKRASLAKKANYLKIRKFISNSTMKAELLFVTESARIFTKFTGMFQREEPLIHVMYKELETLVRTLVGRVCKPDAYKSNSIPDEAVFNAENLLPSEVIVIGTEISDQLAPLKELDRINFLLNANEKAKVFERMVNRRLKMFLETNSLLNHQQHAFRQGFGTSTYFASLGDILKEAYDQEHHAAIISLDISKAFNRTWALAVLRKLANWGLKGHMMSFIRNFLTDRSFRGQEVSAMRPGFLKALLSLFLIRTLRQAQAAVSAVVKWTDSMGFQLSTRKSIRSLVCPSHHRVNSTPVTIHDQAIPTRKTVRVLGVLIDRTLSFDQHFQQQTLHASKRVFFLSGTA